jgi:hypothetical protein
VISIWRQELALTEKQEITAPGLRRIVAIDSRRGKLEAWFEVDTDAEDRTLEVYIVGTGHEVPEAVTRGWEQTYLGHLTDGPWVWHLYSVEPGRRP